MTIIIDSTTYDIPVTDIVRTADFLDKEAYRTEDGILHRSLIGVYFNYQIQFGQTKDTAEYAALWEKLTEPVEYHTVTVPDESGDYTFTAYFSGLGDEIRKVKGAANYWKNLKVNFVAQSPERTPV